MANTLAYYNMDLITTVKGFFITGSRNQYYEAFTVVIDGVKSARVFLKESFIMLDK
jgi:hypothetical protein